MGISIIFEILEFNNKREPFSFMILVLTITFAIARLVAYLFRHRYQKAFSYHLVIIYILTIIKIVVSTQHELKQIPLEDIEEEQHLLVLEKGQRRLTAIFIMYIVFGTPNFFTGVLQAVTLSALDLILTISALESNGELFKQHLFKQSLWRLSTYICMHVLFHREIKRQIISRKAALKWQ